MSRLDNLFKELRDNEAALRDIQTKRDANGQLPADVRATVKKITDDFVRIKEEIDVERSLRATEDDEIMREFRERERTAQNTSTTAPAETRLTHEKAFLRWLTQNPDNPTLTPDEIRLLNAKRSGEYRGTNSQASDVAARGGYLVPESFVNRIEEVMKWYGGMLEVADVYPDNIGGTLRLPTGDDTGETGNIRTPQSTASAVQDMTFGRVLFGDWSIDSGIVKLTEEFLQDERVDFASQYLSKRLGIRIGRKVNSVLTNGTGTNEPYGLTTTVTSSAITTASATAITKSELIRALYKLDRAYVNPSNPSCGFMMHHTIVGYLRTLDVGNTDTVQLFTSSTVAGEPDRLLGLPIFVNNDLEAANATTGLPVTAKKHIFFGDFGSYMVRKVRDMSISRNDQLYWASREVGFMGWLRIDGNLINPNGLKLITQA